MEESYSEGVETARSYYNSSDADTFYATIWGGEDIHVGLYDHADEPIADASQRTVVRLAERLPNLDKNSHVLDLGAGYGGGARYLARTYGCRVTALNLSEVENERHRRLNKEQGLDDLITVLDGAFEEIPRPDDSFDVVWSQDAFVHSSDRSRVLAETTRVLRPGGHLVFTDLMQTDTAPPGRLQPILDRLHLESMGSPARYTEAAVEAGLEDVGFEDLTPHMIRHYTRVFEEIKRRGDELEGKVDPDYIERMKKGLVHWIEGGKRGDLVWGIFLFRHA